MNLHRDNSNQEDYIDNERIGRLDLNQPYEDFDVEGDDEHLDENSNKNHIDEDGVKLWKPMCADEVKPYVNQLFLSVDEGFEFYKEYGRKSGFDVRKSTTKKHKDGSVYLKYFVCSKAGVCDGFLDANDNSNSDTTLTNENDNSDNIGNTSEMVKKKRRTTSSKCSCNAKLLMKSAGQNGFSVSIFIEEHNHALASGNGKQFLRCSRSMSVAHMNLIWNAGKANLGPTKTYNICKALTGSYADVGATATDFRNFNRDCRNRIGNHDVDLILGRFKERHETSNKSFKYEYQMDSNGRLTRIFWTDAIGMRNYEVFGDVISFDATYRTNKYSMIFVPFVGIDNHWNSITFAAALLSKEDTTNYAWVFDVFLKIMGRPPNCIVTDQCPAMKAVIPTKFPGVIHRLCMWHIMKKFPAKLGTLFCAESSFLKKLRKFVWSDHTSPLEFETGWKAVIEEFGLQDNAWLAEMYEIRSSWIPAYFLDDPMTGLIRTTSRSESSNFYFSHFLQKGDNLVQFYMCYESAIERQVHINAQSNYEDASIPKLITTKKIEKDASEQYTHAIFYKIQDEIKASCFDMVLESINQTDDVKVFSIKDLMIDDKIFQVQLNMTSTIADCSCKLYNRIGYLCRHAFFCLNICGIHQIPRAQLNNRWLKNAEERYASLNLGDITTYNKKEDRIRSLTTESWFEFQACISEAAGEEELMSLVLSTAQQLRKTLHDKGRKKCVNLKDDVIENLLGIKPAEKIVVLPPQQNNNKGCRKRILSAVEKTVSGKKRTARQCKTCKKEAANHDSRNCPQKFDNDIHPTQ